MARAAKRDAPAPLSLPRVQDQPLVAWLAIARVYQKIQRRLDRALGDAGLTLAQFDVLANLGLSEGITQQELAGRLLVTKGNVCGLLNRMASAGLVERRTDPQDRRANRLFLTTSGRDALRNTFPTHLHLVQECFAALSNSQSQSLRSLLARIEAANSLD